MTTLGAGLHATLEQVLRDLWSELSRGAVDRHHGFHVASLATRGVDDAPRVRSVVLRRVTPEACEVCCHTDRRSGKLAEIARDARVSWLFYAPELKLQVRIAAQAAFVGDGAVADAAWANTGLSSRRAYLAPRAPGSACDGPSPNLPPNILDRRPTEDETIPARANFGVVVTHATEIDWLYLASEGHQRARFTRGAGGAWSGQWIEP